MSLPWQQGTGADILCGYLSELTVHTWDVAAATGQEPAWDGEVLEAVLSLPAVTCPRCWSIRRMAMRRSARTSSSSRVNRSEDDRFRGAGCPHDRHHHPSDRRTHLAG